MQHPAISVGAILHTGSYRVPILQPTNREQTVFVVDDDAHIRRAMEMLLRSVDIPVLTFGSADKFLEAIDPDQPGCLILDIRLPGIGGLELQALLQERNSSLPIIFISGFGDIPMAVKAMQKGAIDFIEKPFRDQELLDRIGIALRTDQAMRERYLELDELRSRIDQLTNRENEVLDLVVTGMANKVIAHSLGVSQRTVEIHRARVMTKMNAASLAELVRMHIALTSETLNPSSEPEPPPQ